MSSGRTFSGYGPEPIRGFKRSHDQVRPPSADLPGRSRLGLPPSGQGDADHSRAAQGVAGADPCYRVEGTGAPYITSRYRKLIAAGKPAPKAIVAIARELVGFIWAIARRWCTDPELSGIRSLKGHDYFVVSLRRTDFGRAHASIRLRTAQPMAASVC